MASPGSLFSLNERAAQAFTEIAEYLELQGENPFKIKAYVKASSVLRQLEDDLEVLAEAGELQKIPGVGKAIAEKLEQFLAHGTIPLLDELRVQIPAGLVAVSNLPGLGPKKTSLLNRELGIGNLADLRQALSDGKVAELKGFTVRGQAKLLEEVERTLVRTPTYIKKRLEEWAEQTEQRLLDLRAVQKIITVGGVRRKLPEGSSLDLLLVSDDLLASKSDLRARLNDEGVVFREDEEALHLVHPSGCPLRLFWTTSQRSGWDTLRLTGPVEFVEEVAPRLCDSPWDDRGEEDLLAELGLSHLVAEVRHRRELWTSKSVDLLNVVQIQGNLHAHSTDSDGSSSFQEMAQEAKRLGHSYYGVTDHSRSLVIANGLTSERLLEQVAQVRAWTASFDEFTVLAGNECDILEDGSLDYPDEVLEQLDYVVGAVHSFFHLDVEAMTERIVRGLSHPAVKIFAHPTGRLLTRRDGYQADWAKVFAHCAAHDVAVEINASPWRLDISEDLLDLAVAAGCLIAINTDAHSLAELQNVHHGVDMARRGAVPPERVVNTWPFERLLAWLRSGR